MKSFSIVFVFFVSHFLGYGQGHIIKLKNPSFESIPSQGSDLGLFLPGWEDCASSYFGNETPPDIHSFGSDFFSVKRHAADGNTFVGMVTRGSNETWEMINQELTSSLIKNKCYEFKILLARSEKYLSKEKRDTNQLYNFNIPVKLRIWASSSACGKSQLLAESKPVNHTEWKEYTFRLKPNENYSFLLLEVFYRTPVLIPYNGNILIDNASNIVEIPCPSDELLASVDVNYPVIEKNINISYYKKPKQKPRKKAKPIVAVIYSPPKKGVIKRAVVSKAIEPKILKKLDKQIISIGQIIEIKSLYFEADSANIEHKSFKVLDEIYDFLKVNPNVIIEVGGHTNGIPSSSFCNRLSTLRAKTVTKYLNVKGILKYRTKYRGYGKSKPLYTNKTYSGRKMNQRVEIKILKVK